MKLFVIISMAVGLFLARPVFAADGLSFPSMHADIVIQADASIVVTETIVADFSTPHHGIYRVIPFAYTTTSGDYALIPIVISQVKQDGHEATFSQSNDQAYITVKIGDADTLITGQHTYTIRYAADAAANFFSDHDELYWNVTGDQWDPVPQEVTATVTTPTGGYDAANITTTCYTGTYSAVEKNCEQSHTDTNATFSAHDFLTVVVGWPKGFMTMPQNFDELRQTQLSNSASHQLWHQPKPWEIATNALVVAVVFGLMLRTWLRHGRDPGQRKTIIAQYDPPDNLRPAELYAVMYESSTKTTLVAATIVDLAVRGYLRIREIREPGILKEHKDYEVVRLQQSTKDLLPFEERIISGLFDPIYASSETVRLSDLKQRRYLTNPFVAAISTIMSREVQAGYFHGNPLYKKIAYTVLAIFVLFVSMMLVWLGIFAYGGVLAGIIILCFVPAMPQRTHKGAEAAWIGHGFKLFIGTAEKYRVHWQERENIFEVVLPYAMVFGLADKWGKTFDGLAKQPDWYSGSDSTAFNVLAFSVAMNSMSSAVSTATVSTAASGGSGFGGGGFSGGGGGGGGGGGW